MPRNDEHQKKRKTRRRVRAASAAAALFVAGAVGVPLILPAAESTAFAQDRTGRSSLHPDTRVFLRATGAVGESQEPGQTGWIDVLSIDWGASRLRTKSGALRRRGGAVVEDMMLTLEYEKSSPKLQEKCLNGEVIPKLEIVLTALIDETRVPYLKYELTNVLVTSYQTNASGNDEAGPPTVVVGNNFEEIKVTYTEYDDTGSSQGNVETEFKVEKGK